MKTKKVETYIPIILLIGLAIRVFHLYFLSKSPYWDGYFLDELYHHLWAKKIAAGQILPSGVFFRAPLYPYILSAIYSIFGTNGWTPRIFQSLWGLLSIVPFYWVAKRTITKRWLILLAVFLWAINPIEIYFESRLLLDSFFSAGIIWLIYFTLLSREKRTKFSVFWLGIWLGILAITRPTVLILAPLVLIWLWRYLKWRTIYIILALLIPIAPVMVANYLDGDIVPIASQGGINFYIGNNSQSNGTSAVVPEFGWNWQYRQCVGLAERETGEKLLPSQVSSFYMKKGLNFWRNDFASAIKLFGKKIMLLSGAAEIGNNGNIYFLTRGSPLFWLILLGLGWGILIPFMLIGIFKAKFENKSLLIWSAILYSFAIVAFFVCSRFRLPLIPPIIILATAGLQFFIEEIRKRNYYIIAIVLFLGVTIYMDFFGWRKFDDPLSHFSLGNIYFRSGKLDDAKNEYHKSLDMNPNFRGVHLNLGAIYFKLGEIDSAKIQFIKEVENEGEICRALSNLGVIERLKSNYFSALSYGRQALVKCPDNPDVIYNYGLTLYISKNYNTADSLLYDLCNQSCDDTRILNLWGVVELALGDTITAKELFGDVVSSKSQKFIQQYDIGAIYSEQAGVGASERRVRCWAYFNLAQIEMKRGDSKKSEEYLNLSIATDSTFAQGYAGLGAIALAKNNLIDAENKLMRAEKLGLKSIELFFNLAAVKARTGDFDSAKIYLERTLEISPEFVPALKALKALNNYSEKSE